MGRRRPRRHRQIGFLIARGQIWRDRPSVAVSRSRRHARELRAVTRSAFDSIQGLVCVPRIDGVTLGSPTGGDAVSCPERGQPLGGVAESSRGATNPHGATCPRVARLRIRRASPVRLPSCSRAPWSGLPARSHPPRRGTLGTRRHVEVYSGIPILVPALRTAEP